MMHNRVLTEILTHCVFWIYLERTHLLSIHIQYRYGFSDFWLSRNVNISFWAGGQSPVEHGEFYLFVHLSVVVSPPPFELQSAFSGLQLTLSSLKMVLTGLKFVLSSCLRSFRFQISSQTSRQLSWQLNQPLNDSYQPSQPQIISVRPKPGLSKIKND